MHSYEVQFVDGKDTIVEADAYPEQRDREWVFLRGGEIVAQYQIAEVRGIHQLPPLPPGRAGRSPY